MIESPFDMKKGGDVFVPTIVVIDLAIEVKDYIRPRRATALVYGEILDVRNVRVYRIRIIEHVNRRVSNVRK
jgi:hypothetical protein